MSYIQKSKIKSLVRSEGYRISPESFDGINRAIEGLIKGMLGKVEADGMKTLMSQHTGQTQAKAENNNTAISKKCQRCCNVDDAFIYKAKDEQRWFYDEVVRCGNGYSKGKKYDPHFATKQGRVNNFLGARKREK